MNWSKDIGHRETVTDLPHPGSPPPVWSLASLGLPAGALTWASLGITVLVFSGVWGPPFLRSLFRLPWPVGVWASAATVIGAIVIWGCRRRPGRHFPRLWTIGLTGAMALLGLYSLVDPVAGGSPWCHAAALAGFTGTVVLLPRLVRVGPERRWIETIAPAGVAGAMALLVPVLCFVVWSYHHEVDRLDGVIALAQLRGGELEATADQARNGSGLELARLDRRLAELDDLSFAGRSSLQNLWRAAVTLGREDELGSALADLADGLVEGLSPAVAPRVSSLNETAVRWDPEAGKWVASSEFRRVSHLVGRYYQRLGGLFAALDPQTVEADSAALESYRERYGKEREVLRGYLQATRQEWADHWAVARVPGADDLVQTVEPALTPLLQAPLLAQEYEALAPADLPKLLDLDAERARSLAARVPDCRLRSYRENGSAYERVDCDAYSPAAGDSLGAELRIELRLVYVASNGSGVEQGQRPHEVFFLFPVPANRNENDYLEKVAQAVADAAAARWDGALRLLDRSGSALNGFALENDDARVIVHRPRLNSFLKGQKAVVVRAERRAG